MIFINHRHLDALGVGRLADGLRPLFGAAGLYLDRQLEPGDPWPQELDAALQRCDALLAVIGPGWAGLTDAQGRRRLDDPRDWVRREIETALQREVLLVPVFLDGAAVPVEAELPPSLQPLCARQGLALRTGDWARDLHALATTLAQKLDVRRAQIGLGQLGPLMQDMQVAMMLGGSRQGVAATLAQIRTLQAYKAVHDALHHLEHDCQRPIRSGGLGSGISFRRRLAALAQEIRGVIARGLLLRPIVLELEDLLAQAEASMARALQAVAEPAAAAPAVQALLTDLDALIAVAPALDNQMAGASSTLRLVPLAQLMGQVRAQVAQQTPALPDSATTLARLDEGIAALARVDRQLQDRVAEHSLLQLVDRDLRAALASGEGCAQIAPNWARALRRRERLAGQPSPAVAQALPDCQALEQLVGAALAAGQGAQAASLLTEYFGLVGDVFFTVDTQLKDYCHEVAAVADALRQWLPAEPEP